MKDTFIILQIKGRATNWQPKIGKHTRERWVLIRKIQIIPILIWWGNKRDCKQKKMPQKRTTTRKVNLK